MRLSPDNGLRILLVEDNAQDVKLLDLQLKEAKMSFTLEVAQGRQKFIKMLIEFSPDVILCDHSLSEFNSLDALEIVRSNKLDIPFILVTGSMDEAFGVQCVRAGADDYIMKNNLTRLPAAIESSMSKREVRREKKVIEELHVKLQSAYNEIEQMHIDITDSIHYAKRIQEAMLPAKTLLEKLIPESFILYKPKDIISGDFYWFNKVDEKIVVVVADCTGHGVPGALVSMIGNNLLNEIVNTNRITAPGEILGRLNTGIRKLLKQDVKGAKGQDGMDVSICTVDRRKRAIQFAGANQNMIFFHEKKLELVKGDRKSIGGYQTETVRKYTNHQFKYKAGDTLYMCTDGYADQFGGRKEKRMQTKNLIKIIQSTLSLGIRQQEDLLGEWLEKWKGKLKQTDDILLIGIRL
jgi:serine phosphatase RsbU (regulator of sigma subunit)